MNTSARITLLAAALLIPSLALAQTSAPAKSAAHTAAKPSPAPTPQAQPWKKIPTPPLHDFKPAVPTRIGLSNGLTIFLLEDHELPFINGSVLIRGGSRDESASQVGLVSLYADAWRTSGTARLSGDDLDQKLAARAASIETSGGIASTTLTWSSLKDDFPSVFPDALDLLLHPAFKQDKLTLARRGVESSIMRQNDDTSSIARREALKMVYGADSPYARTPRFSTIEPLAVADLASWHDRTVQPQNMIVSVIGDFDAAEMTKTLTAAFSSLQRGPAFPVAKIDFPGAPQVNGKPGVYFVNKPDVNQSIIFVAGLGIRRDNPDYYALSLMNQIFSGGFGSRLFQNVRTRLGLAYAVGGSFRAEYDHPGPFYAVAGTKSVSTVAAAQAVRDEIEKLKSVPPTPQEMVSAREQILNSFIFRVDSRSKVLNEQATLAFYGYPADFLERYRANIEKVTAADITRVADKYVDLNRLATLVVGNASEIKPSLDSLGTVTPLDVTIDMTGAPHP